MFNFKINNIIAKAAKRQSLSLLKKYKNGKTGALVYRGYFGGKHNFAYAQLSTIDHNLYDDIKANHLQLRRYY